MDYLSKSETINNSEAGQVTHIKRDHQVKAIYPGQERPTHDTEENKVSNERSATT